MFDFTSPLWPVLGSAAVVLGGYVANRKLGISEGQKTLVSTLKDEVAALKTRDDRRDREFEACKTRLAHVEQVVEDQNREIDRLRDELMNQLAVATKPRRRTSRTRSDD